MADVIDDAQRCRGHSSLHVLTDRARGDDVVATLKDQCRRPRLWQIGSVVRKKRDACKVLGNLRVGLAEAVGQLHT